MDGRINYLNTDLVLTSSDVLTSLETAFVEQGLSSFTVTRDEDGLWHASFETRATHHDPEGSIGDMLNVIESLEEPLKRIWMNCTQREFNIGYDCGDEPWAFNQGLTNGLIKRVANVGASLRITLYPDKNESSN